jgi:hypothetical protein
MIYPMIDFHIAGAYMMLDTAHEANGSKFELFGQSQRSSGRTSAFFYGRRRMARPHARRNLLALARRRTWVDRAIPDSGLNERGGGNFSRVRQA